MLNGTPNYISDWLVQEWLRLSESGLSFATIRSLMEMPSWQEDIAARFGLPLSQVRRHTLYVIRTFITQVFAVHFACDELGDRTSVPSLQRRAGQIYGEPISYQSAVNHRLRYRKVFGLVEDCRTYATQFKRDMRCCDYN